MEIEVAVVQQGASLRGFSFGCAFRLAHDAPSKRPVTDDKCKKKALRIIHKAEREKHKRDLLNDLFSELDEMLV